MIWLSQNDGAQFADRFDGPVEVVGLSFEYPTGLAPPAGFFRLDYSVSCARELNAGNLFRQSLRPVAPSPSKLSPLTETVSTTTRENTLPFWRSICLLARRLFLADHVASDGSS